MQNTLTILLATARRVYIENGFRGLSVESVGMRAGVPLNEALALTPSPLALFRRSVSVKLERFLDAAAIAVGGRDIQATLEIMLFECGRLAYDSDLRNIGARAVAEQEQYPEVASGFYEESIDRLPIALDLWLSHLRRSDLIALEDPKSAAWMLVGMMTAELRLVAAGGLQAEIANDDSMLRARQCASLFLRGCLKK
ncbi:TetR/AcrR family transcriptional regulator C-terminal domain-containing protein [Tardiphaga sp. P9-11]|uniref:TetR/AcrR family transcriptional regulator C-terminal domain-containing protein n=1 Tax=Tardiphaga sp. P9-11 TaxID=2024614 RepID=UPI0011F3C2E4|nr:TetR/AcrR family transcriptional regulator C-terminal domain-containing protein [Tardiphaga sp. P9-11]KAA0069991.1 hypothetical protein CIW50_27885 [Tardiphaga sp. P9-11]